MEREAPEVPLSPWGEKNPHGMENRLACGGSVCFQVQVLREASGRPRCGSGAPLELWTGSWWEGSAEAGEGCRGPTTLPPRPAPKRAGVLSRCAKGETRALVVSLRFCLPPEAHLVSSFVRD